MGLKTGDAAPAFSATLHDGSTVKLSDFAGKRLLLYFYPRNNTPGCTKEACNLRDNYEELQARGIEILGVSADSEKSHQGFIAKHNLPFALISDHDNAIGTAYGSWGEKKSFGKTTIGMTRRTFLIDGQGRIEHIFNKVNTADHAQQIIDFLEN